MTTTIKIVNPNIEYPSSDGEPLQQERQRAGKKNYI